MKIRVLPDCVANQIAAGEVVGSPASVVKEMTENAIDAGARTVTVNFRADGRELVQVIDDGSGMSPADARLAFDKHATSKITSLDDIYELQTFGFRGEALPSIAAVAEVELTTRREEDELACRINICGGEFSSQETVVGAKGSNFKVSNLFYNVPARRKFLESSEREAGKIKTEFRRVALCHPEVTFMLYRDDAPIYNLPATTLKGRIAGIMGRAITAQLLEVSTETTIVKVEGFVGRPEYAKKRKDEQYFFVNGRFFKSPYLHKAVMAAYEKLIPAGLTPSYFLYLSVDTRKVDVNVHPQKTEVKFSEDSEIWQIVNAAVRESLAKTGVVPMMDFEDEGEVVIPVFDHEAGVRHTQEPRTTINPFYNPFTATLKSETAEGEWQSGYAAQTRGRVTLSDNEALYPCSPQSEAERELQSAIEAFVEGEERCIERELEIAADEQTEFKGAIPLAGGYALSSLGGRMVVVDLERAREVLLYRRYLMMTSSGNSIGQTLLFPERMVFSQDDVTTLAENYDYFSAFGFDFEVTDANTVEISSLPADLPAAEVEDTIYDMLDSLRDGVNQCERVRKERLARILSRSRAPRRALSQAEVEAVLASLEGGLSTSLTPDGRRVVRLVEPAELKALFNS